MAIVAGAAAIAALGSACGSSSDANQAKAAIRAVGRTPSVVSSQPSPGQRFPSYTATAVQAQVDVHSSPGGPTTTTLTNPISGGTPLTFLLTPDPTQTGGPSWVQVYLPVRPNGSTGWIPTSQVKIQGNQYRVVINLSAHQGSLYTNSSLEHSFPVAIGASGTPTPEGTFYITELLKPVNPAVYGDYAYGLSGHSPTLTDFDGYDAEVGLHGTNDPSSVGHSVSHGCIRLYNADIDTLVSMGLPLGTPVEVVA
jgi:lipoprotein-anchoring transpeptidase ErfK/SrfK